MLILSLLAMALGGVLVGCSRLGRPGRKAGSALEEHRNEKSR